MGNYSHGFGTARHLYNIAADTATRYVSGCTIAGVSAAISGKEPLLTRYSVLILARIQTYDISIARRDLGYTPVVSVAEGLALTLETLKVVI